LLAGGCQLPDASSRLVMSVFSLAQGVIVNLFLLLGFVALVSMARDWPAARRRNIPAWANGLLFGAMAVVAMLVPSVTDPGVIFDCRSGVLGAAALLGGPICALLSVPLPCLYRLHVGGAGVVPGLFEIILPAALGSVCHRLFLRGRAPSVRRTVTCSVIVGVSANVLVAGFLLGFMPDLLLGAGSNALVILNGPVSMALFGTLLVIAEQHAESAELHAQVLETAMEGFLMVDTQGRIVEVNEAYCRMSGFGETELLAKRIADLDASMSEHEMAVLMQNVAAKRWGHFETAHRRKDGSLFYVDVSARLLPGNPARLVSFHRDVTERKKAEQALLESERKYKLLIEATNTGFVILDEQGRVLDANPEYVRMTGRAGLDEIRGRPVTEWTATYDLERNAVEIRRCLQTGSVRNLELDYTDGHGRTVPIEIHASLIPGAQPTRILTVCRDITERRSSAEESERLRARLTEAQKMESVGRLAGGIAHDFNNMLGVILGWAHAGARDLPPGSGLHEAFEQIQQAAQRSANLTRQLLAFARRQAVEPKVLDLNGAIERALSMLRRLIGEDIELIWKPGNDLDPVRIDPMQLDQILTNLCANAREAIGHTVGKVTVETGMVDFCRTHACEHVGATPGRHVVLTVTDTGCGMDEKTVANVFEPFFTTKDVGKGTGLGLSIVYGIVKQNDGSIDVTSRPGRGAVFRIYLPGHAGKPETVTDRLGEEAPACGSETVLLAEDEPSLLKTVRMMLAQLGYTVLPAATPGEALRLAQEHPGQIHLLVTDLVMPEMNGCDLADRVLALRPGVKRLFVSGYAAGVVGDDRVLGDAVCFLQKPFLVKELADKVRSALSQ
jgi:two-component system, cell cycle sensor histidine kinase and response regulator CckA